jgi:hypothetical protein
MSTQPQLSPLEQLGQSAQQQQQVSPQAQASALSPLEQLGAMKPNTGTPSDSGEITNDVGQKVIVPKDGEDFADTVKRAIQYHKSLTPEQQQAALDAETSTIPAKTAQTLGAAATTGVVGPALLAVPGELSELAVKHLAGNVLPGMEEAAARAKLAEIAPKALQIVKEWALPTSAVGGLLKLLSMGKKN